MKLFAFLILPALLILGTALTGSVAAAELGGQERGNGSTFSLFSLIEPLGIVTLSFVSATFLSGLFRRKLGRRFLKIHLPLALISVVLGFTHGTLVFILFG